MKKNFAMLALTLCAACAGAQDLKSVPPLANGQCPGNAVRSTVSGLARCTPSLVSSNLPGSSHRGVTVSAPPPMQRAKGYVAEAPKDFAVPGSPSNQVAAKKAAEAAVASSNAAAASGAKAPEVNAPNDPAGMSK